MLVPGCFLILIFPLIGFTVGRYLEGEAGLIWGVPGFCCRAWGLSRSCGWLER